jgi:hypothetical protein
MDSPTLEQARIMLFPRLTLRRRDIDPARLDAEKFARFDISKRWPPTG